MAIAAKRAWHDPASIQNRSAYATRTDQYDYLWHWYSGSLFDRLSDWAGYKNSYGLYRQIRAIHNPVERLVDFYAGIIYPGVLAEDGRELPDGVPLAIPLADDTAPELRTAIGQLWQWSNWQVGKSTMCRYGAALGDVFVEIVDEVDRGKVTFDILWPGWVSDLDLDPQGNVKGYTLEWEYEERTNSTNTQTFTYKKTVDDEAIRTYRNNELFEYDEVPSERDNLYGFAPAVWAKHRDVGYDHGQPALRPSGIVKLDEANSLASHLLDREHQLLAAPIVVSGDNVQSLASPAKRGATADLSVPSEDREILKIITAGANGSVHTIVLPEGEVLNHIAQLLDQVEKDHPELTLFDQLRAMSQVTGPGAERLIGDAIIPIQDARANYDQQSIKLFQMATAIAGWRAQSGAWGRSLTRQQQAFLPFNLDSYQRGDLDFTIMPRSLLPESSMERIQRERMEQSLEADRAGGAGAQAIERRITEVEQEETVPVA